MNTSVSDTPPDFGRFLVRFAMVLICGIVATMLLVVLIDPYGLYGLLKPARFNTVKPGLTRYQEEIKQVQAERANPALVILGNSRAEIGLDPKAAALPAEGRHYNLAIAGTGTSTTLRQLTHLQAAGVTPKTIIIGVEFLDFVPAATAPLVAAAAPAPVSVPASAGFPFWKFDTLFSLASVKDALLTLRIQHDDEAATIDPDGFNPLKEYRGFVRADGYPKIFAQRAQENARAFHRKSTTRLNPDDLQRLQAILQTATAMHGEIKLVIYPYHAQILALFDDAGLWPLFEDWKRHLVAAVAAARRAHPDARISLFDFSGFGQYNCEHVPEPGEPGAATTWYWEGGHFKKPLGDIVLTRVMSAADAPQAPFGFRLEASTMQADSDRIAAERQACVAANPVTFASARKLTEQVSHAE